MLDGDEVGIFFAFVKDICFSSFVHTATAVPSVVYTSRSSGPMHWRGFRNLCTFYICWLGGSFIIPIALVALYFGIKLPLLVLISYYSFRWIFPAKKSEWIRQYFMSDNTPYCRSSKY